MRAYLIQFVDEMLRRQREEPGSRTFEVEAGGPLTGDPPVDTNGWGERPSASMIAGIPMAEGS